MEESDESSFVACARRELSEEVRLEQSWLDAAEHAYDTSPNGQAQQIAVLEKNHRLVGRCWRELERKACDTLSTRDQANATACPKVVNLRHASIEEHHHASCVPVMARRVASLSRTGLPQYRALGVGATPCRLVSLIHTFDGPYGSSLGVDGACQMKVNRMSLALAAFGRRTAMQSKLAGFGRSFRMETHAILP